MGDARREILALDQLHHDRADAVALLEAVDRGDVRMVQRGQHFGFALEAGQALGIAGDRGRQHLDGDLALEARVDRSIHLAHAAGTERGDDLVRTEPGAGCECHRGQDLGDYMGATGGRRVLVIA